MRFWELPETEPWQGEIPPAAALTGVVLPLLAMQLPLPFPEAWPTAQQVALSSVLALGILFACLVLPDRKTWRAGIALGSGGERKSLFSPVWKTLLLLEPGTILLHEASQAVLFFLHVPFAEEQELLTVLKTLDTGNFVIMAAALILIVPCCEEVMFRRLLYGLFRRKCGVGAALLMQAVIFAALHHSLAVFLPLVFFGIVQEAVYLKTRDLTVPVLVHMIFNALTVLSAFFCRLS